MPHSPSDVNLWPINLPEGSQLLDHSTPIVPSEPGDQSINHLHRSEQLERVARHPEGQDVPHIGADADRLQELLPHCPPVTRLPPEILTYIFELYVACLRAWTPDGGIAAQGPSYLTQVCTLWRAVAESDPLLWTSIHFYFPESHASREKDMLRIQPVFDRHLKRSGSLPISLTFTDHRIYHLDTKDLISLLVNRLRAHARRWKRISLHLSCDYFPLLFTFTPCDFSSLENLNISGDVLRRSLIVHLNLESAVNLKSFTYTGSGPLSQERINLHWESLEEVSFGFAPHCGKSCTLFHQLQNLAKCQNITTCSLGLDHRRLSAGPNGTITLPCLQTLRARRLSADAHAGGAIDILTLPRLQTLEIDAARFVTWNQRWHDRNFSDLLTRSRCNLLHLSIRDVDFPNDELLRCLVLSPELTSLRFIPCPRSQDISDVIRGIDVSQTATDGQTLAAGHVANPVQLVPLLREITLASSVEGYLDLMMAMFRSRVGPRARAAGVAALRRAEVIFFDMWHDRERVPEDRLGRVARFRGDLTQWVSENGVEGKGDEDEDGVEASVEVDSPYLPEYIDVDG
ncbi:hypothetical protein OG21DRAFT_1486065 [Imleria badia]|nr:hypothetical protein OG21DRAFT_1486065 [Imleria badia]